MMSATALSTYKAVARRAMPDTATILRLPSPPTRTAGGYQQNYSAVGTTPCRLTTSLTTVPSEQAAAGQLASITHWMLMVPADTDIHSGDRIEFGTALFEVLGGFQQSSWNISDTWSLAEISR